MPNQDLTQYLEIRIEKIPPYIALIANSLFTNCPLIEVAKEGNTLQRFWIKPQDLERMNSIIKDWFEQIQPEEIPKALEESLGYKPIIYGTNIEGIEAKIKEFLDVYLVMLNELKNCSELEEDSESPEQVAIAKEKGLGTAIGKTSKFYDAWGKYWDKCLIEKATFPFIDVSAVWPTGNEISIIPSHTSKKDEEPKPGVLLGPGYHPIYCYIKSDFIIRFRGIPLSLSPPRPKYLSFMGFNESEHGYIKFVQDGSSGLFITPDEKWVVDLDMDRHFLSGANLNYIQLGSGSINKFFAHLQCTIDEFKH